MLLFCQTSKNYKSCKDTYFKMNKRIKYVHFCFFIIHNFQFIIHNA